MLGSKDTYLTVLKENIEAVINDDKNMDIQEIESRLNELQQELLRSISSKADYQKIADEINRLRELKQNIMAEYADREGKRERVAEMAEFLIEQPYELFEFDEQLVRRLIEKITVFDEKLLVRFKSGVEIEVMI